MDDTEGALAAAADKLVVLHAQRITAGDRQRPSDSVVLDALAAVVLALARHVLAGE